MRLLLGCGLEGGLGQEGGGEGRRRRRKRRNRGGEEGEKKEEKKKEKRKKKKEGRRRKKRRRLRKGSIPLQWSTWRLRRLRCPPLLATVYSVAPSTERVGDRCGSASWT